MIENNSVPPHSNPPFSLKWLAYLLVFALGVGAGATFLLWRGWSLLPEQQVVVEEGTSYRPSVVIGWNELMLVAIRNSKPRPTVVARTLYLVHAAMYDAWAVYDAKAIPSVLEIGSRRPVAERTFESKQEAVSQAAYQTLLALFPEYEKSTNAFSQMMARLGYKIVTTADETPAGMGYQAAQAILKNRAEDGSNAANNYADIVSEKYPELYRPINEVATSQKDPNRWQPLRVPTGKLVAGNGKPMVDPQNEASFVDQTFLTPHWGAVRPFALNSGDQFRPTAPPRLGSDEPYTDATGKTETNDQAFRDQTAQVLQISGDLTDKEKVIAEYWADGPRSETPPGHWNSLAQGIAWRDQHTLDQDVKMFFALNGALFDSSIAAWDAKRAYDCTRPINAIRYLFADQTVKAWGGPTQGTKEIKGSEWQPYQTLTFVTPPFPEYVSGHSTFSAAAAEILTEFTGSNQFYDGKTILLQDFNRDGVNDFLGEYIGIAQSNLGIEPIPAVPVRLQWPTLQDAADQAGLSRLYGGIHFQDGDLQGRKLGKIVGSTAFAKAKNYWDGVIQ